MLKLGESATLEFKSGLRAKESIGKAICGFLNAAGGFVLCGIDDKGGVIGTNESDAQIAKFEQFVRESINPGALIIVQRETLDGKTVIVIEVPKGSDPPYAFNHVHYQRDGDKLQIMDQQTIREIVLRSQIEPERWERRFSTADADEDLDYEEVQKAVRDTDKVKRVLLKNPDDPMRVLQDLDVAKYGRLTNAGDVLFSTRPSVRHPQVRIRAMRYNSDKAGEKFSDMKSFEGPLDRVFQDAYTFIVRNTPSVSRFIKGNPKRQDSPLYPEDAVREGLVNALAHRDYTSPSGGVAIHIYPRRLEIWNSGALPEGITKESLLEGHISILRNPDIAHVLYLRGLMEKAGRGSVLMVQDCLDAGLPPPEWDSDERRGVTVTFKAPEVTPEVT
ncbi:MAG: putative DNA binding domain-containing protein, partial [Verrucomicrobiae bacterium]|nr:putative DNA binding domain-containing protein [Verrucomicrobiae bacterium]